MSSNKAEKLFKTYRSLAQIPALAAAHLVNGDNIIQSVWTQRNLEKGKAIKFLNTHIQNDRNFIQLLPIDISTESLSSFSPSQKYQAIIRDIENKEKTNQYLEVWQHSNLIRSVDLTSLDIHGKVYTDGEFGGFEWSPNENKLLYVAERKIPKRDPINKRPKNKGTEKASEDIWKPEEYKQDWGEQMVGKISSIIALYDIEQDEVTLPKGVPENICVAQPTWSPTGDYIAGIAYSSEPRKLGLIYCSNRPSTIFRLDLEGNYCEITLSNKSVKSPRFHPDGKKLIWLQQATGGPHRACMSLVETTLPITEHSQTVVRVDVVQNEVRIFNDKIFHGLYNTTFPRRCWTNDGRLILATNQKNTFNSYIIDLESGAIKELEFSDGSQIVLDVQNDCILVNRRNFLHQDYLAVAKLPAKDCENKIEWKNVTSIVPVAGLDKHMFQYMDLTQPNSQDTISNFSAIYIGPNAGSNCEIPLIIWPHGGPHSAFANNLSLEASIFLSLGYAVLMVNYRGSIGAGQATIEFLPGKAGSADVADCILATNQALVLFPWLDGNRMALVGGSHGGFLVTHLSGQYPDMFKAVVARNPVIDIASMSIISDIPDWCYVESGSEYTQVGKLDEELFLMMRKCSPIVHSHKVKAPTLLQIGTKDLRVPPSQGIEYYHRLKANNVIVNMNIYDDNHPLGTVPNEMDNIISTALWLDEHVC